MKKGFPFALVALVSLIGVQIPAIAHSDSTHQTIQTETLQSLKNQLATTLAKQDQKQISNLQQKLTALLALPPQFLSEQIQISENILVRIFKTDKNLTPKFIDYLYFEPMETQEATLINEMKKNLLVSFLANENAKIYIRHTANADQFVQALKERGATANQIILTEQQPKNIFSQIITQMRQDFPNQTQFPITENRVSLIVPSSMIKPRLALANAMFDRQFKGVEVDDFSYLDQPRENLQHNNETIRYQTFQAMLEGIN